MALILCCTEKVSRSDLLPRQRSASLAPLNAGTAEPQLGRVVSCKQVFSSGVFRRTKDLSQKSGIAAKEPGPFSLPMSPLWTRLVFEPE
jgi:hypothetical protein